MKYSKTKAKERRNRLGEIEIRLKECQEKCDMAPTEPNFTELEIIKSEYNLLYDYITAGNIIWSKANWYKKGEKNNNKFFLNLGRKKMSSSCVRKRFNKDGKLLTSPKLILTELNNFYSELCSNKDCANHKAQTEEFLDQCRLPNLTEVNKNLCEGALTQSVLKLCKRFRLESLQAMMDDCGILQSFLPFFRTTASQRLKLFLWKRWIDELSETRHKQTYWKEKKIKDMWPTGDLFHC